MVKNKFIYIIGSVVIGVAVILGIVSALIFGGVIDSTPRTLVFASGSADDIYNGTPLVCDKWELKSGELKKGHVAVVQVLGEQINVGSSKNEFQVIILDGNGADVSGDYEIACFPGTLTVNKRTIDVKAKNADKIYDGTPLDKNEFDLVGELAGGHVINPTFIDSITYVGGIKNRISASVLDENGNDVSFNYEIICSDGDLVVNPRPLYISSPSAQKVYDGLALCGEDIENPYSIVDGELALGDSLDLTFINSITEVGTVVNSFSPKITDANGVDVSVNYKITSEYGNLTVNKRNITVKSGNFSKTYDGTALAGGDDLTTEDRVIEGTLAAGETLDIIFTNEITNAGTVENGFVSAITNAGGADVASNYEITAVFGTLTVSKRQISVISDDVSKTYDGTPLYYGDNLSENEYLTSGSIADGESLERVFTKSITSSGTVNNAFTALITRDGTDVKGNYEITVKYGELTVNKRPITVISDNVSKTYDGTPLYYGDNLSENEYLTSGSIADGESLERVFTKSITSSGTANNEFAVAIKRNGVSVIGNYAITIAFGTLTVDKRPITIKSESKSKVYDGTALVGGDDLTIEERVIEGTIAEGETLDITFTGQIKDAGTAYNLFTPKITREGVNVISNYEITFEHGMLTVSRRPITVISGSKSKVYDGTALVGGDDLTIEERVFYGTLVEGDALDISFTNEITNAGTVDNYFVSEITDSDGADVTKNYGITTSFGKLTVNKRPITVISGNKSKVYDGTALAGGDDLTNEERVIDGTLVEGDTLDISFTNEIINASTIDNGFAPTITNIGGADVASNYEITTIFGTLTVDRRPITVISESKSKVYDGTALVGGDDLTIEERITEGTLVAGDTLDIAFTGKITDVGTVNNGFTPKITNAYNVNITSNYEIRTLSGTLTVSKRQITVISGNKSKVYDGTALAGGDDLTIDERVYGTLAEGDTLDISFTNEITNAGTVSNGFVPAITNAYNVNVTSNYDIRTGFGSLTVSKRQITVISGNKSKVYDGTAIAGGDDLTTEGRITVGSLANGEELSIAFNGEITNAGTVQNQFTAAIQREDVDVSYNYDISPIYGNLSVVRRDYVLTSGSTTLTYNGDYQSYDVYTQGDTLIEGDSLDETSVMFLGGKKAAGEYSNTFDVAQVVINNSLGEDTTYNYNIIPYYGTIIIEKKEITVTTADDYKDYDGIPLTNGNYEVIGLLDGHTADITITGVNGGVGVKDNTFNLNRINDENGDDVQSNYKVKENLGKLTVEAAAKIGNYDNDSEPVDLYKVNSSYGGTVYLRQKSYGDYNYDGWKNFADGNASKFEFSYGSMQNAGNSYSFVMIERLNGAPYVLPYFTDISSENELSDVKYSVNYIPFENAYALGNALANAEEQEYRAFVYANYLNLPSATLEYMYNVITYYRLDGLSVDEAIARVAAIVSKEHGVKYSTDKEDNRGYDIAGDYAIYFFKDAKTGLCSHYATAATALFRALGIPARYTVGFMGKVSKNADSYLTDKQAHAWVEVYLDGYGWLPVEVTGSGNNGGGNNGGDSSDITIQPHSLNFQITSPTDTRNYSSDTLSVSGNLKKLCDNGYRYEFTVSGTCTGIGVAETEITSFTLYNEKGEEVPDGTFNITYRKGSIRNYYYKLTLNTEVVYDGEEHNNQSPVISGLQANHTIEYMEIPLKNLRDAKMVITPVSNIKIVDENSGNDVTAQYYVADCVLNITRRPITVKANPEDETITESELEALGGTLVGKYTVLGELVQGHSITVKCSEVSESGTRIRNEIKQCTICDDLLGKDMTANYEIITVSGGWLKVKKG